MELRHRPRADFRHLSDAELKDFFDIFDVDGGGSIDVDELPLLIRTLMSRRRANKKLARSRDTAVVFFSQITDA